jgi:hypothetical protein
MLKAGIELPYATAAKGDAMSETPGASPVSDEEQDRPDENDVGEVPTSFATMGLGWSGREEEDEDESDSPD